MALSSSNPIDTTLAIQNWMSAGNNKKGESLDSPFLGLTLKEIKQPVRCKLLTVRKKIC
jgi:hypothetical protein